MKEIIRKIVAFAVLQSYFLVLVPAQELFYEREDRFNRVQYYEGEDEHNFDFENPDESPEWEKDLINGIDGEVGSSDFLVFKSELYKKLLQAKEEFLKKRYEKTETILSDGDDEIQKEWKQCVKKIIDEFLEENRMENGAENETVSDFYSMEREVYNSMLNSILYDQKSLRKYADRDSASVIVNELINEIENDTYGNLYQLFDETRVKADNVNPKDIEVEAQNWLNDFTKQIEEGLEKWDNAEREFLSARFDFEKNTQLEYEKHLESWIKAYEQLNERRENWNKEIQEKIREGMEIWDNKKNELAMKIQLNMEEYQNELYAEYGQKEETLCTTFEVYNQARALLNTASDNIKEWTAKWADRYNGVYSYWKTEYADSDETFGEHVEKKDLMELLKDGVETDEIIEIAEQIKELRTKYRETDYKSKFDPSGILLEGLSDMEKWLGSIMYYSGIVSDSIKRIASTVKTDENIDNNKLKAEYEKAEYEEDYLKEKLEIAKAVYQYSLDKTSGVETLEKTEINLKESFEEYERQRAEYEELSEGFEEIKEKYYTAKYNYENKKEKVKQLLEQIENLEKIYNQLVFDDRYERGSLLKENIFSLINSINTSRKDSKETQKVIQKYFEASSFAEYNRKYEQCITMIETLENGGFIENEYIPSVKELEDAIDEKSASGENYEEEKTLLEAKLSLIEQIKESFVTETLENDNKAKLAIKNSIEKCSDIETLFNELDEIISGYSMSDYLITGINIYKNQLLKELEQDEKESDFNDFTGKISEIFDEEVKINKNIFNPSVYAKLFTTENFECIDFNKFDFKKRYDGLQLAEDENRLYLVLFSDEKEYEELFEILYLNFNEYCDYKGKYEGYIENCISVQNQMEDVRAEYKKENTELNSNSKTSLLSKLNQSINEYNAFLSNMENKYDEVKKAELEYEKFSRIKEYAESVYLHISDAQNSEDGPEKIYLKALSEYENGVEKARLAYEKLKGSDNLIQVNDLLRSYEKSVKEYTNVSAALYLVQEKIQNQIEVLYKAQNMETQAMLGLVKEYNQDYSIDMRDFSVSELLERFVEFECGSDADGKYTYSIGFRDANSNELNLNDVYDFINKRTVKTYDVYDGMNEYSESFFGCVNFLEGLDRKPYGIDDLLLSVCYLKMYESGNVDLFFDGEDPRVDGNYSFPVASEQMFGLNFPDEYRKGRINAVENAYHKVVKNGGLDDIARFIFYSEFNLDDRYQFKDREIDAVATRAMEYVINSIHEKESDYHNQGVFYSASSVALFALGCLPFCRWAVAAGAAAAVSAASCFSNSNSLKAVRKDVIKIQKGYKDVLEEYEDEADSALKKYIASKNQVKNENGLLNLYLFGTQKKDFVSGSDENENGEKNGINYDDFSKSLKIILNSYGISIRKQLFTECSDKKSMNNVLEAILCIYENCLEKTSEAFDDLDLKVKRLRETSETWNEIEYQKSLFNIYVTQMIKNAPVDYQNKTEGYIAEGFENALMCYENILNENILNLINQKAFEYELVLKDFDDRIEQWGNQMKLALNTGESEWNKAEEKLNMQFNAWNKLFSREYDNAQKKWNEEYEDFLSEKNEWIEKQYVKGSLSGIENCSYGKEKINEILKTDMKNSSSFINLPDSGKYVDSLLSDAGFDELIKYTESLNDASDKYSRIAAKWNRLDASEYEKTVLVNSTLEKIEDEMKRNASVYSMSVAKKQIDEEIKNVYDEIESQNRAFEKWELDLVRKDGYTVGAEIYRDAVVDSTVFNNVIRERQTVHRYEFFKCAYPAFSFWLENNGNADSVLISQMMQKSFDQLNEWKIKIFGRNGGKGEFAVHVGEQPGLGENVPVDENYFKNISNKGSGQLGFIMLDFIQNSIRNREGYAALGSPLYDKKITRDNKILGITLPTLRQATQIAFDIVSLATGQTWVGMLDELYYGALDLSFKTKSFEDVAKSVGKAGISMGISSAASKFIESATIAEGFFSKTVEKSVRAAVSNYAGSVVNSYVDAMSFSDGFSIDFDKANKVWTDGSVLLNAAAAGACYSVSTLTREGLNRLTLVDGLNMELESSVFNTKGIQNLNKTISTLASSAVEKAITGKTTINILNTSDLGFDLGGGSVGLFSITFDDDGITGAISESGSQIGLRQIISAAGGISDSLKIADAKWDSYSGDYEKIATLNGINAAAKSKNSDALIAARDVWSGKTDLTYKQMDALGMSSKDDIYINSKFVGNDVSSALQIASLLTHENVHVEQERNNLKKDEFAARLAGYETYSNLSKLYELTEDRFIGESDISFYSEVLDTFGEEGLFYCLFEQNLFEKSEDEYEYYAYKTNSTGKHQTDAENVVDPLGESFTRDFVDRINDFKIAQAYKKYINDQYDAYLLNTKQLAEKSVHLSREEFEKNNLVKYSTFKDFKTALESVRLEKKGCDLGLKDYLINREVYYSLSGYGCTLSVAAYMAYNANGTVVSLKEAQERCISAGAMTGECKRFLNKGENFIKGVNAIAQEEVLVSYKSASKEDEINQMYNELSDSGDAFFAHGRVCNGEHSVLIKDVQNDYDEIEIQKDGVLKTIRKYNSFDVLNPWGNVNSKLGRLNYSIEEFKRVDFYILNEKFRRKE